MSASATRGQREASRPGSGPPDAKALRLTPVKPGNGGTTPRSQHVLRIPGCYLGTNISYKTGKPKTTIGGNRYAPGQKRKNSKKSVDFSGRKRLIRGCNLCDWIREEYSFTVMPYHEPAVSCIHNGRREHCDCEECW